MIRETEKIGVLVLGFVRPELLQRCLEALTGNLEQESVHAFFSLDGPRDNRSGDLELIKSCQDVFGEFESKFSRVTWLVSEQNQGLRKKVLESVDKAFDEVDALIVLEDDCLVGTNSIGFFTRSLREFASEKTIGAISGTYLGPNLGPASPSIFGAKRFNSWGWATWKKNWKDFRSSKFSNSLLVELKGEMKRQTKTYPLPYRLEYSRMRKKANNLDSWAIPFGLFLKSQNLRTLKPTSNLVTNAGFDLDATHTRRGSYLSRQSASPTFQNYSLPKRAVSDHIEAFEAWRKLVLLSLELLTSTFRFGKIRKPKNN